MPKSMIERTSAHLVLSATQQEKFWARVHKSPEPGCWLWTGAIDRDGYGYLYVPYPEGARSSEGAHRVAWELTNQAAIQRGLEIDHLCRNRACVNPAHLDVVTSRVNTLRGVSPPARQAKQTHCANGHALSGRNLMTYKSHRDCRTCWNARKAEQRRQRKASGLCIECGEPCAAASESRCDRHLRMKRDRRRKAASVHA